METIAERLQAFDRYATDRGGIVRGGTGRVPDSVVAELRDIARGLVRESDALACSLEQMKRQRDALLAALNELAVNCESANDQPFIAYVQRTARAAIAAARGEG